MIRMLMRLQKSQVTDTLLKFTSPGTFSFDKTRYILAGYTDFNVLVVGAAGGFSGVGKDPATNYGGGACGGGGGATVWAKGKIAKLPNIVSITVGGAGTNGSAVLQSGVRGGAGGPGGTSSFGTIITAPGGGGALGGYAVGNSPYWGRGGNGANAGYGSTGGIGGNSDGNGTYPSSGNWTEPNTTVGDFTIVGVGGGGGGGYGPVIVNSSLSGEYSFSGSGCSGGSNAFVSPGFPTPNTYEEGGAGGGANIQWITKGAVEYYGGGQGKYEQSQNPSRFNGAVILSIF